MFKLLRFGMCQVFVLALLSVVNGQTVKHRTLSVNPTVRTFTLGEGQPLAIKVGGIGEYGVIALQPRSEAGAAAGDAQPNQLRLKAWSVKYDPNSQSKIEFGRVSALEPLPDEDIAFSENSLTVSGGASGQDRVLLHLIIPDNTSVTLSVNGKLVRGGTLDKGIVVQRGEIVTGPMGADANASIMQVLTGSMHPGPVSTDTILPPVKPGGAYTIPWSALKALITQRVDATYNVAQSDGVDQRMRGRAIIRLSVDQTGTVTRAIQLVGDTSLGQSAVQALKGWRFNPFKVDGNPVPVVSDIPVCVRNGGAAIFEDDK